MQWMSHKDSVAKIVEIVVLYCPMSFNNERAFSFFSGQASVARLTLILSLI